MSTHAKFIKDTGMHTREIIFSLVLLFASILVVIGASEVLFRVALFSDTLAITKLRQPWRFADSSYEDDYWKLAFLFSSDNRALRVGRIDPELGWAPEQSPENPLGLISDTPYLIEDIQNPVLFYGDSFVAGASPIPDRIPQQLDRIFTDRSVLNYGVGGYGVDQIFLRYKKTVNKFQDPLVLVGILTSDLDRSILKIRTGQKPVFDVRGEELIVENLPILPTTRQYIEKYPPDINSYFLRFVMFRLRSWIPESWFDAVYGFGEKHDRKLKVNRMILQNLQEHGDENGISLRVIIFYSEKNFSRQGWREKFLKSTLSELDIPYFDTKQHLQTYIKNEAVELDDLYYPENGHPNQLGNKVIANGIARWLTQ